ncbi:hypothetical protein KY495_12595 [Massilia sp. PAMC28688]|uniref:hypothetical protein n=1 Tax=Massilia sp. PAMC28688 TaxID=2861283 RepID=UPI001C63ACE6|nr:hypothetical protein [Massilia sp. PAMC28688]QYF91645.1 hypothetical protein KY495_12595 [Massilia sp. PAMC28688]
MPAESPRVDAWYRASFPGMSEAERDAYVPADNALTLVSRSTTVNIPIRRGAYFALPELQDAYDEKAKLLIGGERTVWVGVWWTLRVPDSRQVSYGDIVSARAQIAAVQNRISNYSPPMLKAVKRNPYDGIKACFHGDDGGAILVNGEARADAVDGSCKVLFSDSRIANDATIAFAGPVTAVSFIDRRFYTRSK